jgi:hypothetical protein
MTKQLMLRIGFQPAYYEAARIIGYSGCLMSDFWEKAKQLDIPQDKLLPAVYDLTRADKREQHPPRYELNEPARKLCWQVLGPPPEHSLYAEMEEQRKRFREERESVTTEDQGEGQAERVEEETPKPKPRKRRSGGKGR